MWTAETRDRYNRDQLRYPSDLTDEEWSTASVNEHDPSEYRPGQEFAGVPEPQ